MDARFAIEALRHSIDLVTHINDMWVVRNDRIVVQRDNEAVIVFKRLLDIIQRVVALHGIGLGGHFHMGARKLPTRAIVVNHEVMSAQDTWIGHDLRADVGNELGIGSLPEKRVDRVANELDAAPTDIQADRESDPRIELDAWVRLAVGLYIGWSGIELIRDTVNPLLGQAPDPELVAHIRSKIMSYPGVLGTHDLMVHDYGPGRQFASAHVEMAAETDPMESHDTLDNIEQAFKDDDGLIVTLHYDPIVTNDPHVVDMRNKIDAMAKSLDSEASIHDLRCVPGPTHTNVIFDCLHPVECALSPSEFKRKLGDMVVEEYPDAVPKITVDEDYVSAEQ